VFNANTILYNAKPFRPFGIYATTNSIRLEINPTEESILCDPAPSVRNFGNPWRLSGATTFRPFGIKCDTMATRGDHFMRPHSVRSDFLRHPWLCHFATTRGRATIFCDYPWQSHSVFATTRGRATLFLRLPVAEPLCFCDYLWQSHI
jgi:hypothetical protein